MKKVLSLIAAVLLLFGLFHATAETARIVPEPVDFDALAEVIDEYGEYTDRDSVAAYLVYFGTLPCNYITREEARDFGWEEGEDLWLSAPGYSLGGDPYPDEAGLFSAQEYLSDLSPFLECDLNYQGGERGRERLIWNEFSLWYTADGIWFDELYPGDGVLTDWEALLALKAKLEGRYDRIVVSHGGHEFTNELFDSVIECCDEISARTDEKIPMTDLDGRPSLCAHAMDFIHGRKDGKPGNIVYSEKNIYR